LSSVLVVNAGSTSLKLSAVGEDEQSVVVPSLADVPCNVVAVGHRVVHGGPRFRAPVLLDDATLAELHALVALAPLHNAPALAAIEEARRALPALPQVAVFDTEFHAAMPPEASLCAVPSRWRDELHIRRYGFHGLSLQWAAEQVPVERLVVCHLGGGCSVGAIRGGRSIDTTMGFSPLEGVPMATRAGSLDAAAILYLLRSGELSPDQVDEQLERASGLLGLSGISGSVEELERTRDPAARRALDVYCYRIATAVGSMTVALGGLDAIVFTGGVGEGSAFVRAAVCRRLEVLGVQLDEGRNASSAAAGGELARPGSPIRVTVVRAREDVVVARSLRRLLSRPTSPG
jgi:acetate kinase